MFAVDIQLSGRDGAGIWRVSFKLWCDDGTHIWPGTQFVIPTGEGDLVMAVNTVATSPDASVKVSGILSPAEGDPQRIHTALAALGRTISVEAPVRA